MTLFTVLSLPECHDMTKKNPLLTSNNNIYIHVDLSQFARALASHVNNRLLQRTQRIILPQPRLPINPIHIRQIRNPRTILTALPPTQRARRRQRHPLRLITIRLLVNLIPTLHIAVLSRDRSLSRFSRKTGLSATGTCRF